MATKRVRIAVAIDEKGNWSCAGWSSKSGDYLDDELKSMAMDCLEPDGIEKVYFVEADLPLPVAETVQGDVAA